jgi:hypothetical protein
MVFLQLLLLRKPPPPQLLLAAQQQQLQLQQHWLRQAEGVLLRGGQEWQAEWRQLQALQHQLQQSLSLDGQWVGQYLWAWVHGVFTNSRLHLHSWVNKRG